MTSNVDKLASGAGNDDSLVTLDFPPAMQMQVINALKADPKSVDLRGQAPHFYALGARVLELFESEERTDVLLDVSLLSRSI